MEEKTISIEQLLSLGTLRLNPINHQLVIHLSRYKLKLHNIKPQDLLDYWIELPETKETGR